MAEIRFKCFQCGHEIAASQVPGRRDECPKCHADLHVCRNCKHYDRNAYNECREPSAEVVLEKERSNFCDFFTPGGGGPQADRAKDLRAAAEALFKKKQP
jgi:ribosome-binding protein aMBF1 (putative translation factor)